jgi:creatinine amidohydrolase/Fe(II)-dependent formamide hydrolase-like protein
MHGIGTLTVPAETLYDVAASTGRSLVAHGFRVIGLVSTHGGNRAALKRAAAAVQSLYRDVVVCAPEGDVGPDPGTRSGRWLTSVMLSLRPELVFAAAADTELILEVRSATAEEGTLNLERFAAAVVECVRKSAQEHGVVMA